MAEPTGKRGLQSVFTDAAIQTCLTLPATQPSTARQCRVTCTRGAARSACAVIPARKNARPWLETTPGAQARNDTVRSTRRLGRTIWRRWSGYHRRSLVETKMQCFKLVGERVMARDFITQQAEVREHLERISDADQFPQKLRMAINAYLGRKQRHDMPGRVHRAPCALRPFRLLQSRQLLERPCKTSSSPST